MILHRVTLLYCYNESYIVGYQPNQWCCEAPTVPNGIGVWPDTHPNALGKRWGNYLYISIQKRPAYADNKVLLQRGPSGKGLPVLN